MTREAGVAVLAGYHADSLCRDSPIFTVRICGRITLVLACADYTQAIGVYESGEQCDWKSGIGGVLPQCSTNYPSTELQWEV